MGACFTINIGGFSIQRRGLDGYFDANELLYYWNKEEGNTQRRMSRFLKCEGTIKFMDELIGYISDKNDVDRNSICLVQTIPGAATECGKERNIVWMHPYLFIKFAMWINPRFDVHVIEFMCKNNSEVISSMMNSYFTIKRRL